MMPPVLKPSDFIISNKISPSLSSPTTPISNGNAPSDFILFATFPAPPSFESSPSTSITGTGASGEILFTAPQIYLSSITSPTTAIFLFSKFLNSCKSLSSVNLIIDTGTFLFLNFFRYASFSMIK